MGGAKSGRMTHPEAARGWSVGLTQDQSEVELWRNLAPGRKSDKGRGRKMPACPADVTVLILEGISCSVCRVSAFLSGQVFHEASSGSFHSVFLFTTPQ